MAREKTNNVIVISDLHSGCQFALCNPESEVKLEGGAPLPVSKRQEIIYCEWLDFWDEWVPMVTRGERYDVVNVGDTIDGQHHGSVTQMTGNLSIQEDIAVELLRSRVMRKHNPMCRKYFHIKGTEAHVGVSGIYENNVAKRLQAVKERESGQHARLELWLRMNNGCLIHFTHHVGTTSSAAYESTAVYKELVEAFNEAGRWKNEPPDVVVRGHRHRAFKISVPSDKGEAQVIVCPGWQLKTPFVFRGTLGRAGNPHIGGWLIRTGDEDMIYTRSFVREMDRVEEETA